MIPAHHIAVSTQCHEFYSDGSLGSGPLTSSNGYPKALAERTPALQHEVNSRQNNPRPKLEFISHLFMHAVGIERLCDGRRVIGLS